MESEGPAATLSMSLAHPEIHYEPSDYEDCLNGNASGNTTRCTPVTSGLPAQLNSLCNDEDLRQRCNGTAASSPITSGTTDEPMETTSESEPERSHSSNSEPTAVDVDEQGAQEEPRVGSPPAHGSPGSATPFEGKIICNADGVICFIAKQLSDCDVSEFWPAFSSSYIHDYSSSTSPAAASSISSTVPSVLFPFHTVAYIPPSAVASECTVQFFDCQLPCSPPTDVLDLYQNLPLSYFSPSSQESQRSSLYICLVCAPLHFEDEFTFLQHAESQHYLPCPPLGIPGLSEDRSAIIQADRTDRVPVISWLKAILLSPTERSTGPSVTEKVSATEQFCPLDGENFGADRAEEDSCEEADVQSAGFDVHDPIDLVASTSKAFLGAIVVDTQKDVEDEEPPLRIMLDEGTCDQPSEFHENGHDDSDSVHSCAEDLTAEHHHHHHYHEEGGLTNGNGKSSSIECPKCDIVLGSSKSLGGHMTMVHSRNSSKTLKCPKCNWHYKYQETLEIHMKEKHPEAEETCPYCLTGQAHPRLARGEVYSCGYKPYRCDICNYSTTSKGNLTIHMQSDKHVNNVQERQKNGGEPVAPAADRSSPVEEPQTIPRSSSTSSTSRGLSRCDMCNYETNVSRNLRIHMTSEKHQQNTNLFLQARLQEISLHSAAAAQTGGMGLLDQAAIMQLMGMGHSDLMYRTSLAGGSAAAPHSGEQTVVPAKAQPSIAKIPDNALPFQCLVCMNFMTDSMEELREHITRDRSDPRQSDTGGADTTDGLVNGQSFCKYCQYGTKLKANFQLHCKTDKHVQKMQLVNHVREGGTDNAWRLQYLNTSNPVQLRCNGCDYQTSSLSQLRVHLESSQHHDLNVAALQRIRQFCLRKLQSEEPTRASSSSAGNLQNASSALICSISAAPTTTRKWKLFCSLCTFTAKSQSGFMQHIRSAAHLTRWKQYAKNPFPGTVTGDQPDLAFFISIKPGENLADVQQLFEAQRRNGGDRADLSDGQDGDQSDRDDISTSAEEGDQDDLDDPTEKLDALSHPARSGQVFVCPLCQEPAEGKDALEGHLISKHNVHAEALERLMMLVETSDIWTPSHKQHAHRSRDISPASSDSDKILSSNSDTSDTYRCQKCAVTFSDIDKLYSHQNATGHLELKQTPRGPGYLCWKKGCNQYFTSVNSLQMHFREIHATKRPLESADEEATTDENSQSGDIVDGDDEMNSQALAETGYRDHFRKYKCHRCKVAFTKQIYLTAHNKTLQHRKGEKTNYPMEKYLDPNRPHKCDVCKESFTQKNILLVHFNSVSHLHKKKKYQYQYDVSDGLELRHSPNRSQTPPTAHPSPPNISGSHQKRNGASFEDESKPYRCRVCQIGYTNSSTLDIHVRSVGHQARVARAAQDAVGSAVDLSKLADDARVNGMKNADLKMEEDREVAHTRNAISDSSPTRPQTELPDSTSVNGTGRTRVFGRSRANFGWSSMMENIGMEMVQHYVENVGKKAVRKPKDTTMEPVEGENQMPTSVVDNECSRCHKVFSSPWILKVHRESAHADIIPVRILETVASEYRKAHCEKPQRKRPHPEHQQAASKPTASAASTGDSSTKKKPTSPQPQTASSSSNGGNNNNGINNNYSTADLLAAQMQLFMYPGIAMSNLGMMGMQAAMMNLQPPLIGSNGQFNVNMANAMDQARSSTSNQQGSTSSNSRALLDAQSGQKRNRTRITDEQLQILRGHFDIRNPPSDELLQKLCEQTGLELKVVKHWYRNTLFKERQRNKDSPYNFSVPPNPSTSMADPLGEVLGDATDLVPTPIMRNEDRMELEEPRLEAVKVIKREQSVESVDSRPSFRESSMTYNPMTPSPTPMHLLTDAMREERNTGKRANRTRFTDFQVKALQDYFDKNAYPKDDDLEELSRVLDLSPRVITVWFQNARQKARKSYENTTPPQEEAPLIRTPSLNYQCKKCLQVFQRYYELIRHQRAQCSGTSAGLPNGMASGMNGGGKDVDDVCSVTSASESISSSKTEQPTSSQHERVVWDPSVAGMPAGMLTPGSSFMFPGLYPPNSPFGVLQMEAISNAGQSRLSSPSPLKRRPSSEDEDEESPSNKRVRTTIQPEQLDYLYQQYRLDSNPSRKQLEMIASKTGLKKRVVQVWYQNTRARERKGQLNLHQMAISKRCPVCRLHFSVRAALETHISVKHADVYCKGDINIDDLPDTAGESEDEKSASSPVPQKRKPSPQPSAVPSVTSVNESMKRYYEDVMKKYMQAGPDVMSLPVASLVASLPVASSSKQQDPPKTTHPQGDAPLDLSAPHPKCPSSTVSGQYFSINEDSRSFAVDEDGSDDGRSMSSNTLGLGGSRAGKRFRTQMSNAQLKVMKRLFTEYKTPTMGECELVGREIGLPKRVVQVWFQNARAKEKKNRLAGVEPEKGPTTDHCALCKVTFNAKLTVQDHLFTKSHIELLKQSEDCHDGPLPTNMLARLTSPIPPREVRAGLSSGPSPKKSMDLGQERTKIGTVQSAGGKGSSSAKAESMGGSSHGLQAMPISPFGDLGSMMMNDPNLQMAYMYASMNPYYNPAAMTGLLNPYAGLGGFYDPAVMGTSLQMLQLPPGVGEMIYAKLSTSDRGNGGQSAVAFAQDGKRLSDLRECISPADFACATSSQTDIGSVCRKCQMVFPTEANCKSHQASMCYPGTKDVKNVLKLQQIHFHCSACQKQYATISEFKSHCNSSSHQKSRQSQATPSFKRNQSNVGLEENGAKRSRHD